MGEQVPTQSFGFKLFAVAKLWHAAFEGQLHLCSEQKLVQLVGFSDSDWQLACEWNILGWGELG